MEDYVVKNHLSVFEQIRRADEQGREFWSARDMAKVLEYSEYRHFLPVIEKAKEAYKNSLQAIVDHFEDILDMVRIGKGGKRQSENVKLSRYVCQACNARISSTTFTAFSTVSIF